MLLAILLVLSAGQPADWKIFDEHVVVGTVPQLLAPPGDLPRPQVAAGGVFLPSPLDGYVAAKMEALTLYPDLAKLALDQAVEQAGRDCEIRIAEAEDRVREDGCPRCLWESVRWGVVGVAVGVLVGLLR